MRRDKGLIFILVFLLSVLLVPFAHGDDEADSRVRIVRLSYVEGQVQVAHQQRSGYENATMNVPLSQGDQVRTASDGWAEVQFEDGSTIRLAPETQITFATLARFSGGGTLNEVNLDGGEAEFQLRAHDDSHFRVNAAQRVIELRHTGRFRVIADNSDPLDLTVWKGEVAVVSSDGGQEISVKKNETFVLDPNDVSHYDLEKEAEADDLDQWSNQRDDYLSTNSSGHTSALLPYQYGLADLNYYGQYYDVPGYGYCWQPYGVNVGWDPFANGYWDYGPGPGYVWISSYPWGWMPYRYGQWVFVNGYGWVWQPGLWNRWQPVPRVINPPAGFKPPAPPSSVAGVPGPGQGMMRGNGSPARITVPSTAINATSGKSDRPVISNEHTPVKSVREEANPGSETSHAAPQNENPAPAERPTPVTRFHPTPPVMSRPMAEPSAPHVVTTPPPARVSPPPVSAPPPVHVSPPPVSRPSPPPVMSAPRSFSPPPSPPAIHESSGGGRPHR